MELSANVSGGRICLVSQKPSSMPIPDGWEIRAVHEVGDVISGKALAASAPGRMRPYLRTKNVFDGRIVVDDVLEMPMTDEQFETFRIRRDDVLLNEGQSLELVGRCAIYADEYGGPCAIQNALLRFRAKSDVSALFASHVFRNCQQTGAFARVALQTTSVAHLGLSRFANLQLPWPKDAKEQHAIATALSDVDALIAGLERLIAKKRDIRQAAMQQLLSGQTRLPGFDEDWTTEELGGLAMIRNEKILASAVAPETRCVEMESISQATGQLLDSVTAMGNSSKYTFKRGDVLFGRLRAYLRKYWYATFDGICSTEIWPLVPRDSRLVARFLHLVVQTDEFIDAAGVSYGTHMPRSDWSHLKRFSVALPPAPEQSAIATVLSDMDAELSALASRLAKTRAIKQGMMQELLTGRTRLVDATLAAPVQAQAPTQERKANIFFLRAVLAAEIVDQLHQEPTFGHVKLEKMVFLAEHLCQVDTGSTYLRQAAGPLDRKALHSIDSQLRSQNWFDARQKDGRYTYVPLAKRGGHKVYFDRYYTPIAAKLSGIIETFRALDTERCEIVATLYAAWNDLLRDKGVASDETIVHEVLHHWHEAKQRISEDRWRKALGWMREKGFVPQGVALP